MKRIILSIISAVFLVINTAMAQTFTYPLKGKQGFSLSEKTRDGLHVNYNLGQFSLNQLNYRGESMSEISISAITLPNTAGCPNLPVESRLMAIPQGASARLNVVNLETEVFQNVDIAPALRIQAENEEPDMNYEKDMTVYGKNAFYPAEPFQISEAYIRGVNVAAVSISPFQYNPVTKELRVYTNIELSISFEGGNGHFGDDRLRSPYWDPILAAELVNYDQLPVIDYASRMQHWLRDEAEGAEYLIITPNNDAWAEYANQLKDYRTRQGIITKVYRLDEMPANSTSEIKAWFHNAYNAWEIAPVAVCLLGDHGTDLGQYIPAETVSHPYGSCITDNRYADAVGNDNLPDMVFSRLIAQNASELPVFVGKQLEYEYTNPNMDPNFYTSPITALGWQTERWFQLCSEVFGGYMRNHGYNPNRINCIYQGTPGNIWSSNENTSMVVDYFGPNGLGYIPQSPAELGGWTGGTPQQVVDAVNQGAFWLQHRDHGLETGWGEPAVRNNHIAQMNNVGKLPFVMSINCLTGKFNYGSDCFAEAWMRRTYNGENAGAVGVICPTETSYSFVNDAFVWGVYDLFDGDFMPDYGPYAQNTGNWMPAFGNVAGKYFLAQSAWPYNTGSKDITYTMFTAHCDAFLRIYTQVPQEMNVVHPDAVVSGYGSVNVTAPEGCVISLVKENLEGGWDILAVATATGGSQVINFEPQVPPTVINIVVTGQNYLRYEDTIEVIPAEGSFIVIDSYTPHNTPVNQLTPLSMTFRNVGLDATLGTTSVTISSPDDRLTIEDGVGQFGVLAGNQTVSLENEFSFSIAQNVPDNTKFYLNVAMTCGSETWTGVATITAAQAILQYESMSWAQIFDPGETLTVTATFKNVGHLEATDAVAHIASTSPYISFANNTVTVGTLEANTQVECSFSVTMASNCPETEQIPIVLTLNADGDLVAQSTEILKNTIITVSANPTEGGTVTGTGKYVPGATCTLTATTNSNFAFVSWTSDGTAASYLPTYSFTVTGDAEYVANFQAVTNGIIIGDGLTTHSCLPSNAYYNYTLSQQIYTADEIGSGACQISNISFFNTSTSRTRNCTIYMVNTNKTAFESTNDWIPVTEADQLFSGSVTFSTGVWTTIYFNTPFYYDGSSNIALIVDDNTGSWNSYMYCRVSSTQSNQAISIVGDYTNYDPYDPSSYYGSLTMVKNHIILGIPSYDYTVTVSASPEDGGQVSGGEGMYYHGQSCTVTATPNEGYSFYYWTKNGSVVSSEANYTFPVTGNTQLVAVFGPPINISVAANPAEGGTVTGAGSYEYGTTATITATANEGYVFYRWKRNNSVVSYLSTYSFTVTSEVEYVAEFQLVSNGVTIGNPTKTNSVLPSYSYYSYALSQQIYTADEIGMPCTISSASFFNTGSQNTRSLTLYLKHTDKTSFESSNDWIDVTEADQVFSGSVNVGVNNWTSIAFDTPFVYDGTSNLAIIVDDNSGNWTYYNMSCRAFDAADNQAIYIYSDDTNYDPLNLSQYNGNRLSVKNQIILGFPYTITATASPTIGGTVSGAGTFGVGATCTLTATPNEGYVFVNWTENGAVVSNDTIYSFPVSSDRDLVANFAEEGSICTMVFDLYDSFGDGWNGNYLVVDYGNGQFEQLTISSGSFASYSRVVATGSLITLSWISGNYIGECSFDIKYGNGVLIYHGANLSSDYQYEFTLDCGEAYAPHTITAVADPVEGGTVEGAGTYTGGTVITMTATPNQGYTFMYWTENGTTVSLDPNYSFLVSSDRDLVAHFSLPLAISVTANPTGGGTVTGNGNYNYGTTCTLTATPNPGYVFNRWTKNGSVVSCLSSYTVNVAEAAEYVANFQQVDDIVIGDAASSNYYLPTYYYYSLTEQIYTASEMGGEATEISSVSFFNTGTSGVTRNLNVYLVNTNKNSFGSNTDWIPVTDADLMFSGSVTMTARSWVTIYFSTPFAYDGVSNVALIVDDNSNSYNSYTNGRTFNTDVNQALSIYSYSTNYDPYAPNSYTGTLMSEKNQVIFGIPSYDYTVTVSSGLDGGGTVSGGGGTYYYGQPITLTATPAEGYVFNYWTKNGIVVSCLSNYSLSVTESAEYVANFQEVVNGFAIGDAISSNSYLPTYYYYSLTEQIYTASEMGGEAVDIASVSFFNTGTSNRTRNMNIYMVNTNKTSFESTSDWVPISENDLVFSGSVTFTARGWATVYFDSPFVYDGVSNVALVVDDNSNSYNTYTSCRTFDTEMTQALRISGSGTDYDPYAPTGYTGTLMLKKNQVIFRWPSIITATANGGGTVSGSGSYAYGVTCTLTATPNAGYYFLNWTENGNVVSYDASYSFTVDGDRNLVANFIEGELNCSIVFDLYDSNNNGWSGNYLVIDYGNGNIEQLTLSSGSSISYSREVATGSTIALSWITGSYTYQCSFDVRFENGVPIYHGSSLGSTFQQELNINCAVAIAPYVINAVADPEEGGTIEGAGTYDGGTEVTLTATPSDGYTFCFWSENGQQVSTNASYSFIVSSDRDLVARFSLPLAVSVTTNLASGGTVTGTGLYNYGNTCTLTASPNEGYLFLNWSKNGEVVSCNATYSFIVTEDAEIEAVFMLLEGTLIGSGESTNSYLPSYSYYRYTLSQQIYTPDEIGMSGSINSIAYYNAGETRTRTYNIYLVHTDKTSFDGNTDWITVSEADRVYSGSVTMTKGYWTTITFDTPFVYDGTSNLAVIVDDNTGSWTSPYMNCRVFNANGYQAIRVYSDNTNYDPNDPSEYNGTRHSVKNQIIFGWETEVEQVITLSQGTNWVSFYVEVNIDDLKAALLEVMSNSSIKIQGRTQNTTYNPNSHRWTGQLKALDLSQMYIIIVAEACEISLEGMLVDPSDHPATIEPGSNYIAYPFNTNMTVTNAFADFAIQNDKIQSMTQNTSYNGSRWTGQLKNLESGQGYIYNSKAMVNKTLVFPSGNSKAAPVPNK